ncbi:hypothetical protein VaNZ11_005890, partial [Volvox africanus]
MRPNRFYEQRVRSTPITSRLTSMASESPPTIDIVSARRRFNESTRCSSTNGRPETGHDSSGDAADIEAVEAVISHSGSGSGIFRPPHSLTSRKNQSPLPSPPQQQELVSAITSSSTSSTNS